MSTLHLPPSYSRRQFLRQLIGAGALTITGIDPLFSQPAPGTGAFRFAFLTDLHLLEQGALRCVQGIAAALQAVEKLNPRPDFIICGGDMVHSSRELTVADAEKSMDVFMQTWHANTSLPAHWVFGNHDLVATSNSTASPADPDYAKGLFKRSLHLPKTFYSFDHKGWHFVVLDDIALDATRHYYGSIADEELAFLQADLEAHRHLPTIVTTHIPIMSNLPFASFLPTLNPPYGPGGVPKTLVCDNGGKVVQEIPDHNIRAILCGHLHFQEAIDLKGVKIVNSGAVCGNYWNGSVRGCPEGFGVVDVGADGSVAFNYQTYGWQAASA